MSDQPKPTGTPCHVTGPSSRVCEHGTKSCEVRHTKPTGDEWTVETIRGWSHHTICDQHNSALAAEAVRSIESMTRVQQQVNDQAKEMQTLVDALKDALSDIETSNDPLSTCSKIRTALAKVGTYPLPGGETK